MLGAFLLVGQQVLLVLLVVLVGGAARARAGDRVRDDVVVVDGDQRLRGGTHDRVGLAVGVLEAEEVHVRAGVGGAQDAVDIQRVRVGFELEAARDDHLEHLAVDDGFLAAQHGLAVGVLVPGVGDGVHQLVGRDVGPGEHRDRGFGRLAQGREHGAHAVHRVVVGPVDAVVGAVEVDGVGDQRQRAVGVVVHGHVADQVHGQLGQVQVVEPAGWAASPSGARPPSR